MSNFGTAAAAAANVATRVAGSLISSQGTDEQKLKAKAAAEAERLRQENAGVIEQQAEDLATRVEGGTNYGQEVEPAVAAHIARNQTQADVSRNESLSRRPGESSRDYMLRMAVDPDAKLNATAREEKTFRQTQHFAEREKAIRQVLDYGYGGNRRIDPTMQKLASEFVREYPNEYKAMMAARRGETPLAPAQSPEEREAALAEARKVMEQIESSGAAAGPSGRSISQNRLDRLKSTNPSMHKRLLDAADGDEEKAAALHLNQLRSERRLKQSERSDQQRASRAQAILRRHGGDENRLEQALANYNRNNPDAPMLREELNLPKQGVSDVVARPGDVVEADSLSSLNPRKIANGAVISTPNGAFVSRQFPDGKKRGVPVMQDSATGMFFVDPNATNKDGSEAYPDMESYNSALTRQDRVKFRKALLNSGNSVFANEQRRLDAAREAASSSIPEIRKAGMEEVANLEAELHYRYVTEQADMTGLSTGQRMIEDLPEAGSRGRTSRGPSVADVREGVQERLGDKRNLRAGGMYEGFDKLTLTEQQMVIYNEMLEGAQPFDPTGQNTPFTPPSAGAASPSEAPTEGSEVEPTEPVDMSQAGTTNPEVTDSADGLGVALASQHAGDIERLKSAIADGDFDPESGGYGAYLRFFQGRYAGTEEVAEAAFRQWWESTYKDIPYLPEVELEDPSPTAAQSTTGRFGGGMNSL